MEGINLFGNFNRHDPKLSAQAIERNLAIHGKQGATVSAVTFQLWITPAVRNLITHNPTRGIEFFPVDKQIKYVPPNEDVLRVILAAEPDSQEYLWTIALTIARMSEINRLTWQDVNFTESYLVL